MINKILTFFSFLHFIAFFSSQVEAQNFCSNPNVSINSAEEDSFNNYVINFKLNGGHLNTEVMIIPTVIHIIYRNAADSIKMTTTRINNVINKCNEQLRRLNADTTQTRIQFKPVAADCHIQVCLATKKPDGSTFIGVIYHSQPTWDSYNDYNAFIASNSLDRSKYMNVFVTPDEESAYSTFPWVASNTVDGFKIGSKLFGVFEADMPDYVSEGTVFTHEVAHYLGVYHTFSFSNIADCEDPSNGDINDFCADTPLDWEFPISSDQCDDGNRPCSNPNLTLIAQTENYMFYNKDSCTNMFSKDQRSRMRACLDSLRADLVSPSNLVFTGIACSPLLSVIENSKYELFKIYPNPTTDVLIIINEKKEKINRLMIYDKLGKLVLDQTSNSIQSTVDVSSLPNGIYFIEIAHKESQTTYKFIKQ